MKNKNQTSLKNFKPNIKLDQIIDTWTRSHIHSVAISVGYSVVAPKNQIYLNREVLMFVFTCLQVSTCTCIQL